MVKKLCNLLGNRDARFTPLGIIEFEDGYFKVKLLKIELYNSVNDNSI